MESRITGYDEVKHLALDEKDSILSCWTNKLNPTYIQDWKQLVNHPKEDPVSFRGMASGRKVVAACESQKRDFYYVDTGYLGNRQKRKVWHRVVKNGMQHSKLIDVPDDRWKWMVNGSRQWDLVFKGWKKQGGPILLVTPSEKPCKYYGITREEWLEETIASLKQHTDREIIIRDKAMRHQRVGDGSLYNQLIDDKIFAVVTYQSIAAIEAIGFGIPAFTGAPTAADMFVEKDLSKIETPKYADREQIEKWQHWLAYCQYTTQEMSSGRALEIQEEYGLL